MDWFFYIVGGIGALGLLAFMFRMPYLLNNIRTSAEIVDLKPYEEYESAAVINERWHDEQRIGWPCNYCGMDDCPIVLGHPGLDNSFFIRLGGPKCKWCAELSNINYHLATHGVRRLKKE